MTMFKKTMTFFLVMAFGVIASQSALAQPLTQPALQHEIQPIRAVIRVKAPLDGDKFDLNSLVLISWTLNGIKPESYEISLSQDLGKSWSKIAAFSADATIPNTGWTWNPASPAGEKMQIKVTGFIDKKPYSGTSGTFSVIAKSPALVVPPSALIRVVSPNGGEVIRQHSNTKIVWTANPSLASFTVEVKSAPDMKWIVLAHDLPAGTTSFDWRVEYPPSNECFIKVTGRNLTAMVIDDVSDGPFKIQSAITMD